MKYDFGKEQIRWWPEFVVVDDGMAGRVHGKMTHWTRSYLLRPLSMLKMAF